MKILGKGPLERQGRGFIESQSLGVPSGVCLSATSRKSVARSWRGVSGSVPGDLDVLWDYASLLRLVSLQPYGWREATLDTSRQRSPARSVMMTFFTVGLCTPKSFWEVWCPQYNISRRAWGKYSMKTNQCPTSKPDHEGLSQRSLMTSIVRP